MSLNAEIQVYANGWLLRRPHENVVFYPWASAAEAEAVRRGNWRPPASFGLDVPPKRYVWRMREYSMDLQPATPLALRRTWRRALVAALAAACVLGLLATLLVVTYPRTGIA